MLDLKGHTLRLRHGMTTGDMADQLKRYNRRCGRHGEQRYVSSKVQAQHSNELYRVVTADYNDAVLVAVHLLPDIEIVPFDKRAPLPSLARDYQSNRYEIQGMLKVYGITPVMRVRWSSSEDTHWSSFGFLSATTLAFICDISTNRYGNPLKDRVVVVYGMFNKFLEHMKENTHDESNHL